MTPSNPCAVCGRDIPCLNEDASNRKEAQFMVSRDGERAYCVGECWERRHGEQAELRLEVC